MPWALGCFLTVHSSIAGCARGAVLLVQADKEKLQRDLRAADASVSAIRKQTEGLQLEFDKLLEENESLRAQLSLFDRKYSRGDDKKRS